MLQGFSWAKISYSSCGLVSLKDSSPEPKQLLECTAANAKHAWISANCGETMILRQLCRPTRVEILLVYHKVMVVTGDQKIPSLNRCLYDTSSSQYISMELKYFRLVCPVSIDAIQCVISFFTGIAICIRLCYSLDYFPDCMMLNLRWFEYSVIVFFLSL